jgi:hypothetical protein
MVAASLPSIASSIGDEAPWHSGERTGGINLIERLS